jgi:predicted CXXCH cytochrome family protein
MSRVLLGWISAVVALVAAVGFRPRELPQAVLHRVGNDACRRCHAAISDSYARTAMARTSGPAFPPMEGTFRHVPSGVTYRVYASGDAALLSYDRDGGRPLHGAVRLEYYIGSNTRGRTYLFNVGGFWYQSPINYYAARNVWDMSPGYAGLQSMELNHPVDRTCLFCHASRRQQPVQATRNRFENEPFLQAGVGCERCHGPGSEHVDGRGSMVNPAKLDPEGRDSICVQCHLEGKARITKFGRSEDDFTPGHVFADYVAVFVPEDNARLRRGAVSHVESLAVSRCKRESGASMSCLTCHDPHVQPDASTKAEYYRAKCVGCHEPFGARHHPEQRDCTTCHMPRRESADISHTVVTDHRILRRPQDSHSEPPSGDTLVEFGRGTASARDLGIAYGEIAERGNEFAAREALRLLESVRREYPADPEVLTRLAYLHQARGDTAAAERDYAAALAVDPDRAVAAANLGVFYARAGKLGGAIALWRRAFDNNPDLSEIGVNLSRALCDVGDENGARDALKRVLDHNPDSDEARQTQATIVKHGCRG